MRAILILAAVVCGGCRSAEFAVNHQMTGLHVVAKFEAREDGALLASGSSDAQPSDAAKAPAARVARND
jgi:hypothetical protein